jgi:hypothetical protein
VYVCVQLPSPSQTTPPFSEQAVPTGAFAHSLTEPELVLLDPVLVVPDEELVLAVPELLLLDEVLELAAPDVEPLAEELELPVVASPPVPAPLLVLPPPAPAPLFVEPPPLDVLPLEPPAPLLLVLVLAPPAPLLELLVLAVLLVAPPDPFGVPLEVLAPEPEVDCDDAWLEPELPHAAVLQAAVRLSAARVEVRKVRGLMR